MASLALINKQRREQLNNFTGCQLETGQALEMVAKALESGVHAHRVTPSLLEEKS